MIRHMECSGSGLDLLEAFLTPRLTIQDSLTTTNNYYLYKLFVTIVTQFLQISLFVFL